MSELTLLHAADYPRMPWKNGGGSTEEITRDAGEGLEGFGWRLSIADIGESGNFSSFAGYQRIISVLQGDGMTLQVDGVTSRILLPFDAFVFDGESQVNCHLLGGPIRDFNLIYAPQRYRTRLQWFSGYSRVFTSASTVLLFSAQPALNIGVSDEPEQHLGLYDCLYLKDNDQLRTLDITGRCCLIELSPVSL